MERFFRRTFEISGRSKTRFIPVTIKSMKKKEKKIAGESNVFHAIFYELLIGFGEFYG